MKSLSLLILLTLLLASSTILAENNPRETEQEIAKHNAWHAAKLQGVAFRATGQEPGWLLEITDGEKLF